jgi:Kef-type K+ transport system membrane component KefB
LSKIRQPRVISEIIGGIILGPSVMGRIPGFKASIFPDASMTNLNLVANIGLTLFLFIIGLEVDLRFLLSNWKVALNVGVASMAIPFGLGCAIAVGLYNEFKDEPGTVQIDFPIFMLFIGVAMAITVRLHTNMFYESTNSDLGLPGSLSYPYGTEAAYDPCRCHRSVRRCW